MKTQIRAIALGCAVLGVLALVSFSKAGDAAADGADLTEDFFVKLPEQDLPLPQPLPAGRTEPGFRIRGTKGWAWTADQYLEEIPVLAAHKMNFMMNCYLSMFSKFPERVNEWWLPLSDSVKKSYAEVFRGCREQGIQFCFAIHPQLFSPRPIDLASKSDFESLWRHFAWAQSQGVRWFCVPLDDVHIESMAGKIRIDGGEHARFINRLFERLRRKDKGAQMIFCPTWYWGNGDDPEHRPYLEALAKNLHPDVYLFWTGPEVVPARVKAEDAGIFKSIVKHRVILWDNFPVNDGHPTMHLGPVSGRAADLSRFVDGYMGNPLSPQNQINRIPLLTCADYAYNPWDYDPGRSIGQAILHLAENDAQRIVLKQLVEAYPGTLVLRADKGYPTGYNHVREQFKRLISVPHSRYLGEMLIAHFRDLSARLAAAFPSTFADARKTVDDDVAWMTNELQLKYK